MKAKCFATLLIVLFLACNPVLASQSPEEMLKAVVKVRATIPAEAHTARTLGTDREGHGVLINPKGHILTIGYLIVEAETIEVVGPDDKPVRATFVGYDQNTGFGLVRADEPLGVTPMKLGESSKVKEGDPLIVAGHGGADSIIAARVVSRKEFAGYWEYVLEDPIFTAPAYLNFGGAALIDPNGQLVGIGSLFTQVVIPGVGTISCNMFVPVDLLKPILNGLMTKGRSSGPPRPWLGINAEETHGRVFITQVTPGGPAEQAGLRPGDLVLSVDGKAVGGLADFYRKIWALGNAGVEVSLTLLKGTQIQEVKVRSADRYQFLLLKPQFKKT
ncbi:MAG TPA: S1C family serine protease [Thermodesulfobacteriota bacterium]|nr:S1C family serine protease [Thermodesulfobacteriota bacterium]